MAQESRLSITVDTRPAEVRVAELAKLMDLLEAHGIRATSSMGGFEKSIEKAGLTSATAAASFNRLFKAGLAGFTVKGVVGALDAYGQMADRLKMATESAAEYELVQKRLLATANSTYRPLQEAQELYIRTADSIRALGFNTEQTLDITDSFSYLLVTNAASADRASSAIDAYSKSIQTGRVSSQEWQSILSAMPSLLKTIADALGKDVNEVKRLGIEGKLALSDLNRGLLLSVDTNKKLADGMGTTAGDAAIRLKNNLTALWGEKNRATGATATLAAGIDLLSDNLNVLSDVAGGVAIGALTLYASRSALALKAVRLERAERIMQARTTLEAATADYRKAQSVTHLAQLEAAAARGTAVQTQMAIQHAQARQAEAAALTKVTTAQTGLRAATGSLLGVFGGPVGLAVTAGIAASSLLLFSSNANAAEKSADDFRGSVDLLTASLDKMGASALGNAKLKIEDELISLGQTIAVTKIKLESLGSQMNAIPDKNSPLYKQMYRQMMDLAQSYEETRGRADGLRAQLEKIAGLLSAPISVGRDQTSQAFAKFESQIDRQIALIGKSGNAAQLRYDLEKGLLGEMSEAEQKRAREKIDALEAGEQAEEARRKAAAGAAKMDKEAVRLLNTLREQVSVLGMSESEVFKYQLRVAGATDAQLKAVDSLFATKAAFEKTKAAQEAYKLLMLDLRTEEERTNDQFKDRIKVLREAGLSAEQYQASLNKLITSNVSVAPKFDGLDASVGGASGELIRVAQARAELDKWRADEIKKHQEYLKTKEGNEQAYAAAILKVNQDYNQQQASLSDAWRSATLVNFASVTGDAAEMLRGLGHEGSAAYKVLFLASKASSIAQAILSTHVAAARALADLGPVAGPPMAATITKLGYASIGIMAATSLSGMAHSGIDQIPREGTWLLDKGERVLSPRQNSDLTSYLKKANTVSAGAGGGGQPIQINVEVNIANDGTAQTQVDGAGAQQGRQLVEMVAGMVQQGLAREMRQGGLLWNQRNGYSR